jgi:hypothetical protein
MYRDQGNACSQLEVKHAMTLIIPFPEVPTFSREIIRAWWLMNPTTHMAIGYCPSHRKYMLLATEDHLYGRQPSCGTCGAWLDNLELVALP